VVYYEGREIREDWRHIEEVETLSDYLEALSHFPVMAGMVGRDYKIDLDARMARKSFMQAHAVKHYGGKVFWIDADTITHSPVPDTFLDEVLPDDKLCCYLGRDWKTQEPFYTESGFIGFNAQHPVCKDFFLTYLQIFISGVIFTRKWWHDCAGFDAARDLIIRRFGPDAFVDLAKDLPDGCLHPFVNTVLGKYMDHLKGRRKGKTSRESDLVVDRQEPYWQSVKQQQPSTVSPSIILPGTVSPPSRLKEESLMRRAVSGTAPKSSARASR
jgi:hypothetical protein